MLVLVIAAELLLEDISLYHLLRLGRKPEDCQHRVSGVGGKAPRSALSCLGV